MRSPLRQLAALPPRRRYLAGAALLLALYVTVAVLLAVNRDVVDRGPLSFPEPARSEPLPGAIGPDRALGACFPGRSRSDRFKVVGGLVDGRPYYACYKLYADDGSVDEAVVVDGEGYQVSDVRLLKRSGAWPWIGTVRSGTDLAVGALGMVALLALFGLYYRRARPGAPAGPTPWWRSEAATWVLLLGVPVLGWVAVMAMRGVSRGRKTRLTFQLAIAWSCVLLFALFGLVVDHPDPWGLAVLGLETAALLYGLLAGRAWLRPGGFGVPEGSPVPLAAAAPGWGGTAAGQAPAGGWGRPPAGQGRAATTTRGTPPPSQGGPAQAAPAGPRRAAGRGHDPSPRVQRPGELPSFADVGGMEPLKQELRDTVGLVLAFAGEAESYRITWNGLLLHGRPGVGKTFVAKATAGEFGLNFVHATTGDLVSSYRGESARLVEEVFRLAAASVPCVLFFDEFDSVAQRREDWPDQESRRTVNQLLQTLEAYREVRELIVMAATNDLDGLDPAVIRPGRFDRHVRVDLPDQAGRAAIFRVQLRDRPTSGDLDVDLLAARSENLSPAAIARAVESAALAALRETAAGGSLVRLDTARLLAALAEQGGRDRPTVAANTWDDVVLPAGVKAELQQLQVLLERPEEARALGVELPSGVLLSGPPGTGKTTVAKVLAAQARCSFYPVTGADLTSMWLGESERKVRRLFDRARENQPSIVFIDEIDAIASERGTSRSFDPQVNQLLAEIDGLAGQRGVLVLAATNRPDQLDPALLRGGRLSRQIEIPPPDLDARADAAAARQGDAARGRRPGGGRRAHRGLHRRRPQGAVPAGGAGRDGPCRLGTARRAPSRLRDRHRRRQAQAHPAAQVRPVPLEETPVPCIFCIAVFLIAASVVTAATVDELEERLEGATSEPVERAADTESVTLWNATFEVAGKAAPVAITVYKRWGRARIQVLTHELSREQVEELEDRIAELLGLRVVSRSDEKDEEPVRQAQEAEAAARAEEAQPGEAAPVERPEAGRVPMPPPPPKG
jgi:SpoVK/Ycf46/Vps4 family AAA+-type ATPase